MGVNLEKHKDSLLAAWKDVVDDKTSINWALFGYEGHTTTLKVISKGDEGLEEMIEELSSGKIMYAFCKVMDPNTSLPKFVFINWQGEAAPLEIKGKCANHVTDVVRFFKGAHVTINARTEDDVDVNLIINKVAKSTVSAYNFKDRSAPELESSKPVGSVYKRIIPTAEINAVERDKFWEKEEAEEKRRLEEERKKLEETKQKLEEERKQRELQEARAREEREKLRMRNIHQLREAEKLNSKTSDSDQARWEQQLLEDRQAEEERRHRRDSLCQERKEEARALISQRTIDARAIFEQKTAAGQMSGKRHSFSRQTSEQNILTNSSLTNSVTDHNNVANSATQKPLPQPDVIPTNPPEASSPSPEPDVSTGYVQQTASSVHLQNSYVSEPVVQNVTVNEENNVRNDKADEGWLDNSASNVISQEPQLTQYEYNAAYDALYNDTQVIGQCLRARALYDYQAADETEISFDPDDIITHIEQIDEGWWQGVGPDGQFGLFPANYVELIE